VAEQEQPCYTLGLDLGTTSIGWAVVETEPEQYKPRSLVAAGVRLFDAGVEGDIAGGRDESRATKRRQARLQRRNTWRRKRRQWKVFRLLQEAQLLPPLDTTDPEKRHQYFLDLDKQVRDEFVKPKKRVDNHVFLYQLRALALDGPLPPHAVGRALYHLAQRRGFLSNRKGEDRDDEDRGNVKKGIADLEAEMAGAGSRTLGDPEEQRIRQRWTRRSMYQEEFEKIWVAQAPHHASMTEDARRALCQALFYQRPLKSQRGLIGHCDLEPDERRCRIALRTAQRFRLIQGVNHLRIRPPGNEPEEKLTQEQRVLLIETLTREGDLKFSRVRKLFGLPQTWKFNLEDGGEKRLIGNRTESKLAAIFGDRWCELDDADKDAVVEDLLSYEKQPALASRGRRRWGLDSEQATAFSLMALEQGHMRHSVRAIERLLVPMADGVPYATARQDAYPESYQAQEQVDQLPPLGLALPELRNPTVSRVLGELRKVVNGLARRYGKPARIRIELGRDLKTPRTLRERRAKENRARQAVRGAAKQRLLEEAGIRQPSRADIEKVLLADECGWTCPYTGKGFDMARLVGPTATFDVEHILPFSRSLDDSYLNKTICDVHENRHVKGNRTPFEAYSGNVERWHEIIDRVRHFNGDAARIKLHRLQMEEIPAEFASRDLNDTRFASRLAMDYLGLLYGGRVDEKHVRRLQASSGRVTAHLRRAWQMNAILGMNGHKSRGDHRHHAVDAIAVALAGPRTIELLAHAAQQAWEVGGRLYAPVTEPWRGFLNDARRVIADIAVSRRVNRRLRGPLHEETLYSKRKDGRDRDGRGVAFRHVRKPLAKMSPAEVSAIVDDQVRELVRERLDIVGDTPKKVFADEENLPHLRTKDGRVVPIRKARIRLHKSVASIGSMGSERHVAPGTNHHMAIVASLDERGNEVRWEGHVVSLLEATQRYSRGEPVVQRDWGVNRYFKFSLTAGEFLSQEHEGKEQLVRVVSVSENDIESVLHTDARPITERKKIKGARIRGGPDKLRQRQACKVSITPLGDVVPAND